MEQYRDLFLAEAREYLQGMTEHLLKLEKDPAEMINLTEVFRSAHSLKGMAGTMGYDVISRLTHGLETLLDSLRGGSLQVGTDIISLLFEAVDLLQLMLDNLEHLDDYKNDVAELEKKLQIGYPAAERPGLPMEPNHPPERSYPQRAPHISAISAVFNEYEKEWLKDVVDRGESIYHVHVWLREGSLLKSVRVYMVYKALEGHCEVIKTVPSMPELDEGYFDHDFYLIVTGNPDPEILRRSIEGIAEIEQVLVTRLDPEFALESAPDDAHTISATAGAVSAGEAATVPPGRGGKNRGGAGREESKKPGASPPGRIVERTVRVETAKLDVLVNLVGELIINRTRVLELGKSVENEPFQGALEQLERITTDLQAAVMTLRMVPIKQVFDRFPRMIRDLSIEKGKEVELIVTGEETELDRTIVNQVGDPLVHLLRNAVDHGIEAKEERAGQGKNRVGRIAVEAHHEGSHVVVSVADDGRGINPDAIKSKAQAKGIASREELAAMSDDELVRLIFHSGFSTSQKVTDTSGRGVGMDVVKTAVEALNGTVEIKNELGRGAHFALRLPLTLAIIRALMVEAGGEIYAIPVEAIHENILISPSEIKTVDQARVITLREDVLPLHCLTESLGMGTFTEREIYPVVVVRAGQKKAGLIVDELMGQQEIVIKSLGGFVSDIKGIAGATVLGDGRVTLILDAASLLKDGRVGIGKESTHH